MLNTSSEEAKGKSIDSQFDNLLENPGKMPSMI